MIYEGLEKSVREIKMSDETKRRIISNCYSKALNTEVYNIKNNSKIFKRVIPLAAIIIFAVSMGVGVANHIRGFKDMKRGTAVVGTVYEEASEMIVLDAVAKKDNLSVYADVLGFAEAPYCYLDVMDISSYQITDISGEIISKGSAKPASAFENGKVSFEIPLNNIPKGEYVLVINEFTGIAKADQPLPIKGTWKCSFIK